MTPLLPPPSAPIPAPARGPKSYLAAALGINKGASLPIPISPSKQARGSKNPSPEDHNHAGDGGGDVTNGSTEGHDKNADLFGTSKEFLDYVLGTSFENLSLGGIGGMSLRNSMPDPSLLKDFLNSPTPGGGENK